VTPTTGAGCSPGAVWNNASPYPGTVTLAPPTEAPVGVCTYVFTLPPESGCVFDVRSVARRDKSNQCAPGVLVSNTGCRTIRFTFPKPVPDRFKLLIACGGSVCPGGEPCSSPVQSLLDDTSATDGTSGNRPPWAPGPGSAPGRG
jgi:hypothetical protein